MSCGCDRQCPYVTTEKQPVIADTFGPFHDETILAGVDKMLHLIGSSMLSPSLLQLGSVLQRHMGSPEMQEIAKKLSSISLKDIEKHIDVGEINKIAKSLSSKSLGNIGNLIQEQVSSGASASKEKKDLSDDKMNAIKSATINHTPSVHFGETSQRHLCPRCGCKQTSSSNTRLSSFLKNFDTTASKGRHPKKSTLKRSFSLCSLACRHIKEKLSNIQKNKNSQWLCTRRRDESQHQIFEIYQNFKRKVHSTHSLSNDSPKMILVITPCGAVFPFETVSCHF